MFAEDSDDRPLDLPEEATYVCPSCGESIVVPVDLSGGRHQQYVEDCPVCCCPNRLTIDWNAGTSCTVRCEAE